MFSFLMYFNVGKIIILLIELLKVGSPYKHSSD